MAHIRTSIKDALVTAVTGLATTATRVHRTRAFNLSALPALRVYFTSEQVVSQAMGGKQERKIEAVVHIYADGADVDDKIDLIASEVEAAVLADAPLAALCQSVRLSEIQLAPLVATAEPLAEAIVVFALTYRTVAGQPAAHV